MLSPPSPPSVSVLSLARPPHTDITAACAYLPVWPALLSPCSFSYWCPAGVDLFCRRYLPAVVFPGGESYTPGARRAWREHVLSSVAGNDPLLADALWEIVFESDEAIGRALRGYAARRGWNSAQLTKHGANEIVPSPLAGRNREPPRQRELWAMGAVVQTEEFGLELHSAAL